MVLVLLLLLAVIHVGLGLGIDIGIAIVCYLPNRVYTYVHGRIKSTTTTTMIVIFTVHPSIRPSIKDLRQADQYVHKQIHYA